MATWCDFTLPEHEKTSCPCTHLSPEILLCRIPDHSGASCTPHQDCWRTAMQIAHRSGVSHSDHHQGWEKRHTLAHQVKLFRWAVRSFTCMRRSTERTARTDTQGDGGVVVEERRALSNTRWPPVSDHKKRRKRERICQVTGEVLQAERTKGARTVVEFFSFFHRGQFREACDKGMPLIERNQQHVGKQLWWTGNVPFEFVISTAVREVRFIFSLQISSRRKDHWRKQI